MADAINIRVTQPAGDLIRRTLEALKILPQTTDHLAKMIEAHRVAGRIHPQAVEDITGIIADLKFREGYEPDEVAALAMLDAHADALHALEAADFSKAEEVDVQLPHDLVERARKELVDLFESGALTGRSAGPMRAALRALRAGLDADLAAQVRASTNRLPTGAEVDEEAQLAGAGNGAG